MCRKGGKIKMKEIKFRGKRINNGEWVYGFYFEDNKGLSVIREPRTINTFTVIPETVGRYTGREDKNGKEIFEGDTIKAFNGINKIVGIVRFGEYEQDGSGGEYRGTRCIGFYVERTKTIPNEWEVEDDLLYEPDYEKTNSLLAYKNIEILKTDG